MTVRMSQSFNGYFEGQIVNLGGVEEARLIALNFASADLNGPASDETLAKIKTDPLTGELALLAGSQKLPIRMARAAKRAEGSNPFDDAPWNPAPAWAISTPVGIGSVLSANGNLYQYQTAGTTAGSGGGPTGIRYGNMVDGTATCIYRGPIRTASALAGAPTITMLNLVTTDYPKRYDPVVNSNVFAFGGGVVVASGSGVIINGVTTLTTGDTVVTAPGKTNNNPSISFMTDSDYFFIKCSGVMSTTTTIMQLEIDGRLHSDLPIIGGGIHGLGTGNGLLVDLRTSGKKARKIKIWWRHKSVFTFEGIYTDNASFVWAIPAPLRMAWLGESFYANGIGSGSDVPSIVANLLGFDVCHNISQGSSGFVTTATNTRYRYLERLADATELDVELFVICAGYNDSSSNYQTKFDADLAYLRAYRLAKPSVPIVVFGTWTALTNGVSANDDTETAMRDAVAAFADANCVYIPIRADVAPWGSGERSPNVVTGITQAAAAVVSSVAHGAVVGDIVMLQNILGMTEISGIAGKATAVSADTITTNINSSAFTAFSASASSYVQTNDVYTSSDGLHPQNGTGYQYLARRCASAIRNWVIGKI